MGMWCVFLLIVLHENKNKSTTVPATVIQHSFYVDKSDTSQNTFMPKTRQYT